MDDSYVLGEKQFLKILKYMAWGARSLDGSFSKGKISSWFIENSLQTDKNCVI